MSQMLSYGAPPRTSPSSVTISLGTPTFRVPPVFGWPATGVAAAAGVADTATGVAAGGAWGTPLQAATTPAPALSANKRTVCLRVMTWVVWFRLGIRTSPTPQRLSYP